jgi:hypothetical protein
MPSSTGARIRAVAAVTMALAMPMGQANAQQRLRMLTPASDSCRAFTLALTTNDKVTLSGLAGWALGFISGVAGGTGTDYLQSASADGLIRQLDLDCRAQPRQQFSAAVISLSHSLMAGFQHK